MFLKVRALVPALALILAQAGSAQVPHPILTPQQVEANRLLEPARAAQAAAFLAGQNMGLTVGDTFRQLNLTTNSQGQAVVRFQQLHQGVPVYGSAVTVRISPGGAAELLATDVAPGLALTSPVQLTPAQAVLAAHRNINPAGAYSAQPTAELMVFPTGFAQGFKVVADPASHAPRIDRDGSLVGPRPTAPFIWAYRVDANLQNSEDGFRELHLIVDAGTGQVLRKWDDRAGLSRTLPRPGRPMDYGAMVALHNSTPKVEAKAVLARPRPAADQAVPAVGWGHDQYRGLVPLDTIQSPLGTGFDLVDMTRSQNPHANFQTMGNQTWFMDAGSLYGFAPPLSDYVYPYLANEFYNTYTMDDTAWSVGGATGAGSPDNVWGDGTYYKSPYAPFVNSYPGHYPKAETDFHYGDVNGQSAAVGAHFAMSQTYDMYKYIMGRLAIDGRDSGIVSVVHDNLGGFDNAHWDNNDLMMHYGDGDYDPAGNGQYNTFTSVTIGGHEMSHGEMYFSARVNYYGEGMGLNEGNSDIMGMCVEAYSKRLDSEPKDRIPEGRADWMIAPEISVTNTPLRWMYKPSLDGISPDAWYAGINQLDGHYSMGVPNRFFYFLAMGASADSTQDAYSPYRPQGLTGIGIDAAGRIWYKAVSEFMTSSTSIVGIRGPLLAAAADLYGTGSTQYNAVMNALAAVNIGAPADGPGRPVITFPKNLVDANSPLGALGMPSESYSGAPGGAQATYYSVPFVPMGETSKLQVTVGNSADTSVVWTTGWPILMVPFPNNGIDGTQEPVGPAAQNGSFSADGTYRAPLNGPKFCMVKATSAVDPLEYGYLPVVTAMLDTDGDGEQDAVDMGAFALCYGLPLAVADYLDTGGEPIGLLYYDPYGTSYVGYSYDDYALQAFNEAFQNAFAQ